MNHVSNFQRVIHDVIELAELQWQLFAVDSQSAKQKIGQAVAISAIAMTVSASALTVLIAGLGLLLYDFAGLPVSVSLIIAAVVVFAISGILLFVAFKHVKTAGQAIKESKSELAENMRWLKATLVSPYESPRNQIRSESFRSPPVNPGSRPIHDPVAEPYQRQSVTHTR